MKASMKWILAAVVCVAIVIGATVLRQNQDEKPVAGPDISVGKDSESQRPDIETPSLSEALGVSEDDMIEVGGVKRPKRDLSENDSVDLLAARDEYLRSLRSAGKTEAVNKDANAQVAKLHSELEGKERVPQSQSILFSDEAFDREAYLRDPTEYLGEIRPSRSIQSHEPGPEVTPIKALGSLYNEIVQGESVILQVEAEPEMPVTFHAQLGQFDNKLKTISVASSKDGIAKAVYKSVSGVRGNVRISAASPVHSNKLSYLVRVSLPNEK